MNPNFSRIAGKTFAELSQEEFSDLVRKHGAIGTAAGALMRSPRILSPIHSVHMMPGAAGAMRTAK